MNIETMKHIRHNWSKYKKIKKMKAYLLRETINTIEKDF